TWSALEKRSGGQENTGFTFTNPLNAGDVSVWHLQLKSNPLVIAKTAGYIQDYIQANPPVPVQPTSAAAPASGTCRLAVPCMPDNILSYWLTNQGQWFNHGMRLQISPAPGDG